jgi:type IV pilus assembly protein PilN
MYNIDINLLKDRPEYQSATVKSGGSESKARVTNYSKTPIFVGLGVGLLALIATGGGWLYLDNQGKELQAKQAELDKKLGAAKTQEAKLAEVNGKITQSEQESQSLANVFNMVRPWSAILREFQESVPQGMQIRTIAQIAVTPPPASPSATPTSKVLGAAAPPSVDSSGKVTKPGTSPSASASPSTSASPQASASTPASSASPGPVAFDAPVTRIQLDGVAQSFNEVNSFILTLKQSPFFNPNDTQLIDSSLVEQSVQVTAGNQSSPGAPATSTTKSVVTKSVKYTIQTSLKQVPAAELLRELESKGALGLVTRLKSLQQQQVIKP